MTFRQQRDVFRHMAAGALLLLAVGTAAAERLQDQPSVRQFGAADGPISANVTDVAMDEAGELWVGMDRGLMRYDGTEWHRVLLPARGVLCLEPSRFHGIIVGTEKGAYSFRRHRSRTTGRTRMIETIWTLFDHPYLRSRADSAKRAVLSLNEQPTDGAIWFGTQTGAKRYNVFEWVAVDTGAGLPIEEARAVASTDVDADPVTWIGTPRGLYRWADGALNQPASMPRELRTGAVDAVVWDTTKARLWVGAPTGVYSLDGTRWRKASGMPATCLAVGAQGYLYAGGASYMLRIADRAAEIYATDYPVTGVTSDGGRGVWIGTNGGGLLRWIPSGDGETDWRAGPVQAMALTAGGYLAIAAGTDVWRMSVGRGLEMRRLVAGGRWNRVNVMLATADGAVWLGTDTGAYKIGGGRIALALDTRSMMGGAGVHSLVADAEGTLWIGAENGIWQMDIATNRLSVWRRASANVLYPVARTNDGSLWTGTNHGVYSVRGDSVRPTSKIGGIVLGKVRCAAVGHDGGLWFGDDDGNVVRLPGSPGVGSGATDAPIDTLVFGPDDGIAGLEVRSMAFGPDSSLWVATDGGVSRYRDGSWARYSAGGGLKGARATSVVPLSAGMALVGTEVGVEILRPETEPPDTRIVSCPPIVASSGDLSAVVRANDRWQHTPPAMMRLSFRLDDGPWTRSGSNGGVSLAGVPAGDHTLFVRAIDGDLNVDPTPAVAEFLVEAPLWRRWPVIALYIVIAMLGRSVLRARRDR